MTHQHQLLVLCIQVISGAMCLAVAMNALTRRGGLVGMRGMLALAALSAAMGLFSLLGASLETDPAQVIRWHVGVRISLAGIGAGAVGAALTLIRPGERRGLLFALAGGVVTAVLGAMIALGCSPEQFVRTPVSWFPTSRAVRIFDTAVIVLASTSLTGAAVYRLVRGAKYRRRTMWLLVSLELAVALSYFAVRMWAPPAFMQAFGVGLTTASALIFWGVLHDWRVAGVGDSAYTLLFRSIPRPVVLLDLHTESLVLNGAAEALLGRGERADAILERLGFAGSAEQFLSENAGRTFLARSIEGAKGRAFDVHVHFDPDEGLGLLQIDDVTERVDHARKLERSLVERQEMQERLLVNEKMAAVGVLVAGVNHEINNPLAYASTNIAVAHDSMRELLDGVRLAREAAAGSGLAALREWTEREEIRFAEEEGLSALADAADGCSRIKEIVASMRMLTRQERAELVVDLAEMARAGVKVGSVSMRPGVRMISELSGSPLPVRGLPGELTRVITNLVVNAGQGVGESGTVWVRGFHEEGMAVIEVCDDGPGIRPEHRSRIFEPFFTTKPPGQGTGLGLAISFEIARRHGGELLLVDHAGHGACLQLRLPCCVEEESQVSAQATPPDAAATPKRSSGQGH